jgi:hypothetical protein
LKEAYLTLRARTHELALDDAGRVVDEHEFENLRGWIVSVWQEALG